MPDKKCPACLTLRLRMPVDGRWSAKCVNDKCHLYQRLRQT